MPELPEIENLKRTLEPVLIGRNVEKTVLRRSDFAQTHTGRDVRPLDLLRGDRVGRLERLGKQLAIVGESGRAMCVHLGMSGQLFRVERGAEPERGDHVHVEWLLEDGSRLLFRDPRRFGGLWLFSDLDRLRTSRWAGLGPDALTVRAKALEKSLGGSTRVIKSALLDQRALAGVGNIYADEALFGAGVHPLSRCASLSSEQWKAIASAIRSTLRAAIRSGGSTLRDYRDGEGRAGSFQSLHRVYGRSGTACDVCAEEVVRETVGQRTTCWCPVCQRI